MKNLQYFLNVKIKSSIRNVVFLPEIFSTVWPSIQKWCRGDLNSLVSKKNNWRLKASKKNVGKNRFGLDDESTRNSKLFFRILINHFNNEIANPSLGQTSWTPEKQKILEDLASRCAETNLTSQDKDEKNLNRHMILPRACMFNVSKRAIESDIASRTVRFCQEIGMSARQASSLRLLDENWVSYYYMLSTHFFEMYSSSAHAIFILCKYKERLELFSTLEHYKMIDPELKRMRMKRALVVLSILENIKTVKKEEELLFKLMERIPKLRGPSTIAKKDLQMFIDHFKQLHCTYPLNAESFQLKMKKKGLEPIDYGDIAKYTSEILAHTSGEYWKRNPVEYKDTYSETKYDTSETEEEIRFIDRSFFMDKKDFLGMIRYFKAQEKELKKKIEEAERKIRELNQEGTQNQESALNQESDLNQEGTLNQESDLNQEGTLNQESDLNQEGTLNQESDLNQEGTQNQESDQNLEGTLNQESDQNLEGTLKYRHLWVQCDNCDGLNYKKFFFSTRLNICEHCGFNSKMGSSDRIELPIDKGTWNPMDEDMSSTDPIQFDKDTDPDEGTPTYGSWDLLQVYNEFAKDKFEWDLPYEMRTFGIFRVCGTIILVEVTPRVNLARSPSPTEITHVPENAVQTPLKPSPIEIPEKQNPIEIPYYVPDFIGIPLLPRPIRFPITTPEDPHPLWSPYPEKKVITKEPENEENEEICPCKCNEKSCCKCECECNEKSCCKCECECNEKSCCKCECECNEKTCCKCECKEKSCCKCKCKEKTCCKCKCKEKTCCKCKCKEKSCCKCKCKEKTCCKCKCKEKTCCKCKCKEKTCCKCKCKEKTCKHKIDMCGCRKRTLTHLNCEETYEHTPKFKTQKKGNTDSDEDSQCEDSLNPIVFNKEEGVSEDCIDFESESKEENSKGENSKEGGVSEDCIDLEFEYEDKDYKDRIDSYQEETGLTEAVQTGTGKLNGIPVAIGVMDFEFIGGSMGSVVGEKITRLIEYARKKGLPLIIVCASGGARMQEGSLSLMQMAKISAALHKYQTNEKLLYISMLTSPTTGGVTASFGMLGDIIITEPDADIAFTGKRVIEQTLNLTVPEDLQTAEYLFEKGLFDLIVPRNLLKNVLNELLKFHAEEAKFKKKKKNDE